jgi:hypothetical protein
MSDEDVVYEITVDLDGIGKNDEVQIPGLGTFKNGSTYEVTRAEAEAYRSYNTRQEPVHDEDDNIVGAEAVPGPTLLQAFRHTTGVDVTTAQANNDDEEEEEPVEDEPDLFDEENPEGGDQ